MMKSEDWVDSILRQEPLQPVIDDGFTERVVARLPAPRPIQPLRWPIFTLMAVGVAAASYCVDIDSLSQAVYRVLVLRELSWTGAIPVLMVFAACAWAIADSASDDVEFDRELPTRIGSANTLRSSST